jgi:hypothetical protein
MVRGDLARAHLLDFQAVAVAPLPPDLASRAWAGRIRSGECPRQSAEANSDDDGRGMVGGSKGGRWLHCCVVAVAVSMGIGQCRAQS